jgi:hypothetical protein
VAVPLHCRDVAATSIFFIDMMALLSCLGRRERVKRVALPSSGRMCPSMIEERCDVMCFYQMGLGVCTEGFVQEDRTSQGMQWDILDLPHVAGEHSTDTPRRVQKVTKSFLSHSLDYSRYK